jgi:dipeptidase E
MKIALAGGGGAEDSRLLDEVFASWIGPQGKLLYLPVALRGIRPYEACLEWITTTFAPLHLTNITMWTDLAEHRERELGAFDAVYVGGGNTYSLLAQLIDSHFDRYLQGYAEAGGILYGGSAGAIVLGKDIQTADQIDHNDIGLTERNCLNLANDHAVWPHYQPEQDPFIAEFVQEHQQPVLAIPERSGIAIASGSMRSVGFEPAYRFDDQGKSEITKR